MQVLSPALAHEPLTTSYKLAPIIIVVVVVSAWQVERLRPQLGDREGGQGGEAVTLSLTASMSARPFSLQVGMARAKPVFLLAMNTRRP